MDINTIINSLENAENDNKRFALLLILAELIKTNKLDDLKSSSSSRGDQEKCQRLNEKLFASIGSHFLARLLTTRQSTENVSPVLYKAVGMSILTQFLDYERLACDPIIVSKLDIICQILAETSVEQPQAGEKEVTTLRRNLYADTFKYLFALSRFMPDHLCQNTSLLDILVSKIILNESHCFASNLIENVLTNKMDNGEEDFRLIACKLFSSLCKESDCQDRKSYEKLNLGN